MEEYLIPTETAEAHLAGCCRGAEAGWAMLAGGGSAIEAVETAARLLENDPTFDVGCSSLINAATEVEKVPQQVPLEKKQ